MIIWTNDKKTPKKSLSHVARTRTSTFPCPIEFDLDLRNRRDHFELCKISEKAFRRVDKPVPVERLVSVLKFMVAELLIMPSLKPLVY